MLRAALPLCCLALAAACNDAVLGRGDAGAPDGPAAPADLRGDAPPAPADAGPDLIPLTDTLVPLPCLTARSAQWATAGLPSQTGIFRVELAATPGAAPLDAVVGLALADPASYEDLAAIVRFGADGTIDARDGADYNDPAPAVPFAAGQTYRVRFDVDAGAHLYSAYVTDAAGGIVHVLGERLRFRDSQQAVAGLDRLGAFVHGDYPAAELRVCDVTLLQLPGYCGNDTPEPGEACDAAGGCCDRARGRCALQPDGTSCGSGGTCKAGTCTAPPESELLRVDFDAQPPDDYARADFESDFVVAGVTKRDWSNNHERTDIVDGSAAYAGRSLRGRFLQGVVGGSGAPLNFGLTLLSPYEELFFSYRVAVAAGYDFVKGGKLPGVGGGARNTGGNPPSSTDPEGFSVRLMWRTGGEIVFYVYHADLSGIYGEDFPWMCGGQPCKMTPGAWQTIELRVKMNTPGKADGIAQGWLDGKLAITVDTLRFRDVQTPFSIDGVLWSNFFGGNTSDWAPTKEEQIFFDDVVLSTGPITH